MNSDNELKVTMMYKNDSIQFWCADLWFQYLLVNVPHWDECCHRVELIPCSKHRLFGGMYKISIHYVTSLYGRSPTIGNSYILAKYGKFISRFHSTSRRPLPATYTPSWITLSIETIDKWTICIRRDLIETKTSHCVFGNRMKILLEDTLLSGRVWHPLLN